MISLEKCLLSKSKHFVQTASRNLKSPSEARLAQPFCPLLCIEVFCPITRDKNSGLLASGADKGHLFKSCMSALLWQICLVPLFLSLDLSKLSNQKKDVKFSLSHLEIYQDIGYASVSMPSTVNAHSCVEQGKSTEIAAAVGWKEMGFFPSISYFYIAKTAQNSVQPLERQFTSSGRAQVVSCYCDHYQDNSVTSVFPRIISLREKYGAILHGSP